jgi:hypothetical protein
MLSNSHHIPIAFSLYLPVYFSCPSCPAPPALPKAFTIRRRLQKYAEKVAQLEVESAVNQDLKSHSHSHSEVPESPGSLADRGLSPKTSNRIRDGAQIVGAGAGADTGALEDHHFEGEEDGEVAVDIEEDDTI